MAPFNAESYNELFTLLTQDEMELAVASSSENGAQKKIKNLSEPSKTLSIKSKKSKYDTVSNITSSIAPIPPNHTQFDVRSFVLEVFENIIAFYIVGLTFTLTHIRQMSFCRAILEIADNESRLLQGITPKNIYEIILSSICKSGLLLV